jgi:hypothetical protein
VAVTAPGQAARQLGPSPLTPKLSITASSAQHGARHVSLVFGFAFLMRCAQPGPTPIVISLPKAAGVPTTTVAGSVLLNGKATTAKLSGHTLTVTTPQPPRVMCDLIGIGTAKITLTSRSGVRNPLHAGRYLFTAAHGKTTASARLTIR